MPARVILLRHGMTGWNLHSRYDSRTDVPLHPSAPERMTGILRRLDDERIDRILTSPALRARQTAALVAERRDPVPPVRRVDALRELDFGAFEGRTRAELQTGELAGAFESWLVDGRAAPGGESWAEAVERVGPVLTGLAGSGGSTLCVAHGYVLRVMLLTALRLPPGQARTMRWPNGGAIAIACGDGEWTREQELSP